MRSQLKGSANIVQRYPIAIHPIKGNTKSDDNWAHKPSKCVKNSGSVCYGSLCPSNCKKIKFILPVPGHRHVDARASLADDFRAASDVSKPASRHLGKRNSAFD